MTSWGRRVAPWVIVAVVAGGVANAVAGSAPSAPVVNVLTGDAAGFDGGTTGRWSAVNADVRAVPRPSHAGAGALRVQTRAVADTPAVDGAQAGTLAPVRPGVTYTGRAWVRAAGTTRPARAVVAFYDETGVRLGSVVGAPVRDGSAGWTRTPPAAGPAPRRAAYAFVGVRMDGAGPGEVHYVDTASLTASEPEQRRDYRAFSGYRTGVRASLRPAAVDAATFSGERPGATLLGYFDADLMKHLDPRRLDATEAWLGRRHVVLNLYTNFADASADDLFDRQLPTIDDRDAVAMITWMPWVGTTRAVDHDAAVAAGSHDRYLRRWAARLRTFLAGADGRWGTADDRRAYLRFAHEMNGDWYPYAPAWGASSAASFVAMWRHVHDVVTGEGLDAAHLQWIWSVNVEDSSWLLPAEAMYPGDRYVDWVGLDGYDRGSAANPDDVFGSMLARVRALTAKPVAVTEVGATDRGVSVAAKTAWVVRYFAWVASNDVRLTAWFDEVDAPNDFRVVGGAGDVTVPEATAAR